MIERAILYLTTLNLVRYPASHVGREAFLLAIRDTKAAGTPFVTFKWDESGRRPHWRVGETNYAKS
jgi:hypothetical protein